MRSLLLSINPQHVTNILNETKKFEFRKNKCKHPVDSILIYCTSPVKKVVGEAQIGRIIEDNPETVWELTKESAGISKRFFDDYYEGKSKAVAYELTDIVTYALPKSLSDFGIEHAPQSFAYIDR